MARLRRGLRRLFRSKSGLTAIEVALVLPPFILLTFGIIVWRRGFTHDDRVLFRLKKGDPDETELPPT